MLLNIWYQIDLLTFHYLIICAGWFTHLIISDEDLPEYIVHLNLHVLTFAIHLTEFCEALDGQDLERPAPFCVCEIKENGHCHTQNGETLEGE